MPERINPTDEQKAELLRIHGMRCFIDGHPIEHEDDLEFDHIVPVAVGGVTAMDNLAPVCRRHNRQKRTMSLSEYRDYLKLSAFFDDGLPKYLDDVIMAKNHIFGELFQYEISQQADTVNVYFANGPKIFSLYMCPVTKWQYFYALIPIQYLINDKELQPRALRKESMWGLYRHFQRNTQLSPSICRTDGNGALLLFDGQHKAAAQIWSGRKIVECKVYINPEAKSLKETNLEAHQSYRQMSFYSSELMKKYADICGEDWNAYALLEGRKSEKGFVEFLVNVKKMTAAKAKSEVEQAIQWRILNSSMNKLNDFTSDKNRARRQPLTHYRIKKTIFRHFLSPIPCDAEFESSADLRGHEEHNIIRIMSVIAEEGLIDRWNPEQADAMHQRTERIFSAGSIRAWVRILRDILNAHFQLYLLGPEEAQRIMYRELTADQVEWTRKFIRLIFSHSVWDAPDTSSQDISRALTKDDDTTALALLRDRGLTVEWVLQNVARP
ncbi:MAG: HNH endonuclease [Proteobacteria bacterium]|nr:HNH endonuclease [Pseudomonadota bacterium]